MRIICNHLRQGRSGKDRVIRTFSNVNMQNTAQIRASLPPVSTSLSRVALHNYAFPPQIRVFVTRRGIIMHVCSGSAGATDILSTRRCPYMPLSTWAIIQHSRDDEPQGVLMQMRNVRATGCFFSLSGVPDLWDRNKILRCSDLSVPFTCAWLYMSFLLFCLYSFLFWIMYLL